VAPVSRALIGNRFAVVVRTPQGDIAARPIPAGSITLIGAPRIAVVDAGARLLAFVRMDGALLASIDIAERKATTAMMLKVTTRDLAPCASPARRCSASRSPTAGSSCSPTASRSRIGRASRSARLVSVGARWSRITWWRRRARQLSPASDASQPGSRSLDDRRTLEGQTEPADTQGRKAREFERNRVVRHKVVTPVLDSESLDFTLESIAELAHRELGDGGLDAEVIDEAGRVRVRLEGYRTVELLGEADASALATIHTAIGRC
jgi:hypothetical protein